MYPDLMKKIYLGRGRRTNHRGEILCTRRRIPDRFVLDQIAASDGKEVDGEGLDGEHLHSENEDRP